MQKLTGIDFVAMYALAMFELSGYSGNASTLLAGGSFFGYIARLALTICLCERFGRRKLMLRGSSLMWIVLLVGAILSHEVTVNTTTDFAKQGGLNGSGIGEEEFSTSA